jgi:hypothetical protein
MSKKTPKLIGFPDFRGKGTATPVEPVDVFIVAGSRSEQKRLQIQRQRNKEVGK